MKHHTALCFKPKHEELSKRFEKLSTEAPAPEPVLIPKIEGGAANVAPATRAAILTLLQAGNVSADQLGQFQAILDGPQSSNGGA